MFLARLWTLGALSLRITPLVLVAFVAACEGVGIVATDDPYANVSEAKNLWAHSGRVMQARRLLDKAIAAFEQRGDKAGLAEAYREYGLLARTGGARPDIILIRPPLKPDTRSRHDLDLSNGYFERAVALATEAKRFDIVSNIDLQLGDNLVLWGDAQLACPLYDRALVASHEDEALNPGRPIILPQDVGSFAELVNQAKAQARCSS